MYNMDTHLKIPASQARQKFFDLLDRVKESHLSVIIEKKGKPVAILQDYEKTVQRGKRGDPKKIDEFFDQLQKFTGQIRKRRGKAPAIDSVALLRQIRDES